jgi:hypothetical protein
VNGTQRLVVDSGDEFGKVMLYEKEDTVRYMSSDFKDKRAGIPASSLKRKLAGRGRRRVKMSLYLSPTAKENLEKLRLKSLDKRGRKPAESQIIEDLINTAAKDVPQIFYPRGKRSG